MKRIGVGFIGCGMVSELHYEGLLLCPEAKLVSVYNRSRQKAEMKAKAWSVKVHDSVEELVTDPEVDVVFVLTSVECHYEHTLAALHAGKHVLVEKPVATTEEEIIKMNELAKAKGLICMPAHNYIYLPEMMRMKRNLELGIFGRVPVSWMLYHVHHSEELAAGYPGIIRQIGTHLLYSHRYLFGAPRAIDCHSTHFSYPHLEQEDQMLMTLTMPDGSLGNLFASFAVSDHSSSPWTVTFKVLGTLGSTQLSWQDVVFDRALGTLSRSYGQYEESYANEIRYLIQDCIGKGSEPLSTMEDALEVLRLVQKAEISAHHRDKL